MYGKELILDLHNCNKETMTKENLDIFFQKLCELIEMESVKTCYWIEDEGIDPVEYKENPHLQGISAVHFIRTSSITIHAITGLKKTFINIFSCKNFNSELAEGFAIGFFEGTKVNCVTVERA